MFDGIKARGVEDINGRSLRLRNWCKSYISKCSSTKMHCALNS